MRSSPAALLRLSFIAFWTGQCLIAATLVGAIYANGRQNWIAVSGYLGSIALVLNVWAAVLSLRGRWNGDPTRWWKVVPFYVLNELSFFSQIAYLNAGTNDGVRNLGDLVVATGLPLFIPFFTIVGLFACPIGSWLANRRFVSADHHQRRVRVTMFTASVVAVLSLLLLPIPLFLYCACPPDEFPSVSWYEAKPSVFGWRSLVADWMPNIVRDTALEYSIYLPWPTRARCANTILIHGRSSRSQLIYHLYAPTYWPKSSDDISDVECAFDGLVQTDSVFAQELAFQIARGDAQEHLSDRLACRAGRYLARNATPDEIRGLFRDASESDLVMGLVEQLAEKNRREFAPAIENYAEQNFTDARCSGSRRQAVDDGLIFAVVTAQEKLESPEEFIRQWGRHFADPKRQKISKKSLRFFDHLRPLCLRFAPIMNAWTSADNQTRRLLLNAEIIRANEPTSTLPDEEQQTLCDWLQWLITKHQDQDIVIRRAVAHRLAEAIGFNLQRTPAPCVFKRPEASSEFAEYWNDANVFSDNQPEIDERDYVCALAQDYIAKNKGGKQSPLTPSPPRSIPPSSPSGSSEPTGTALSRAR